MLGREDVREQVPRSVRPPDCRLWVPVWGPGEGRGGREGWLVTVILGVRLRSVDIIWS